VQDIKTCREGDRVSFRARALRLWEVGGLWMCLVGDKSALTRVELGRAAVEESRSYEFRDALVQAYPGRWHSVSLTGGGKALPLAEDLPISQNEAYIERTYKILTGVQRKKARREGRIEPWSRSGKRAGR